MHAFLDGRDTPPKSAEKYIRQLQRKMKELGVGQLATHDGAFLCHGQRQPLET